MIAGALAIDDRRRELRCALLRDELKSREKTVIGFVCPDKGHTHSIVKTDSGWTESQAEPSVYLPAKLERVVKSNKRFIIIIGGRGSAKSVSVADICLIKARDEGVKTYCLREYQSSIKNSVHSLLKEETARLGFHGFNVLQNSIEYKDEPTFQFAGLARNVDSIKSAHGFGLFWIEEGQFTSDNSLRTLTPTARNKPKAGLPGDVTEAIESDTVSMIFVANLQSQNDAFSQRFVVPFQDALDRDGYYEDDLHLIIKMNYTDNPWYADSGLEKERLYDYDHKPRAIYDHVWLGAYNDDVENAIIPAEWFDAAIDAHLKIKGWEPKGIRVCAHDPSDLGPDPKGLAARHGTVVTWADEILTGDVNDGCDEATDYAIQHDADYFIYDADGMGASLRRQVNDSLMGKKIRIEAFQGASAVVKPEEIYQGPDTSADESKPRTNKETFRNLRSQKYWELRDRFYRTYRAIVHGDYNNPDDMISLSSQIPNMSKLRSEMCRIPRKPSGAGYIQIMSKDEMITQHIPSPNIADSVYMLFGFEVSVTPVHIDINFRRAV